MSAHYIFKVDTEGLGGWVQTAWPFFLMILVILKAFFFQQYKKYNESTISSKYLVRLEDKNFRGGSLKHETDASFEGFVT